MRRPGNAVLALSLLAGAYAPQEAAVPAHGVEYRGGSWFDGSKFVPKTMYVADGVFRTTAPTQIDSVVDLEGGYVVPPFSDAHQHLIDPNVAPTIQAFRPALGPGNRQAESTRSRANQGSIRGLRPPRGRRFRDPRTGQPPGNHRTTKTRSRTVSCWGRSGAAEGT